MRTVAILLCTLLCACNMIACSNSVSDSDTRYKLYPTTNMWTFLKLDTETGKIWQVQYSTRGDDTRFELPLNSGDIAKTLKKSKKVGRYELYPTQNMYNFILLDKIDGDTYQVQWGMDASSRMLMKISK